MGFFSKLFTAEPVRVTISNEREAYASVMLACMFTDGQDSEEERMFFISMVSARPLFSGYDVVELYQKCFDNYRKLGSSAGLIDAAAGAITEKTRLPLFVNCVDLILSDGQVTAEEEQILDYLKGKFNVDDDLAGKVTEVLLLKNKV